MPTTIHPDLLNAQLFTREEGDDGRVRWRRRTAAPRGAAGPVMADAAPRPAAHEPIGCPDPFPLVWLEERPDWLEAREGVRIVLDGPELGRAAGYVRIHGSCYQDGTPTCRIPPGVTYEAFYRGEAQVIDEHGEVREVAVGSIAIVDGHSDPKGTHRAAVRHLDKPEKMKLRGVLIEDEVGLLFLGCGRPDLTRAEAVMVNQCDVSAEWWPLFEAGPDGRVGLVGNDLIGIALVAAGAYRKSIPDRYRVMAAALGRELDDDEVAMMFNEMGSETVAAGYDDGGCGCRAGLAKSARGEHSCTCSQPTDETVNDVIPVDWRIALTDDEVELLAEPAALEVPVLAAATEDMVAELQGEVAELRLLVETLRAEMDSVQRMQIQMLADELTEEEITLPDRVDQQEAVQRAMDERLAKLEAKTADATASPTPAAPDSQMPGGTAVSQPVAAA